MTTNRPEFKEHDDFIFENKKIGKVTREEFIKYIRNSHEHMRKLSKLIQQYDLTFEDYLREWDGKFESFDDDVKDLLGLWIQDGTMDTIINDNLMSSKADKTYVEDLHDTTTSQLEQMAINLNEFGAIGDGLTDDTLAIQHAIDYAKEHNLTKIEAIPNKNYKVTKALYNRNSNLHIDFKGSTISYHGTTYNQYFSDKNIGMFNNIGYVEGLDGIGDTVRFLTSTKNPANTSPNAKNVISLEGIHEINGERTTGSRVSVSDSSLFEVGDTVIITGKTRATLPYDSNLFEPDLNVITNIVGKDNNYLYTDYVPPFDFIGLVNTDTVRSSIVKVEPVRNLTIENLVYRDEVRLATINAPNVVEREGAVGGIMTFVGDNISIKNFKAYNHKFNAVLNRFCMNSEMENLSAYNPQMWTGGTGYCIQNFGVTKSTFKRLFGNGTRHVIDMSASNHSYVDGVQSVNPRLSDVSLHGIVEHDIYYNNIKGSISLGNGINDFPEIVGKVVVNNSNSRLSRDIHCYIKTFIVKNSEIETDDVFKASYFETINTKYKMRIIDGGISYNSRNIEEVTECHLDGDIIITGFSEYNATRPVAIFFRDVDKIRISKRSTIKPEFHPINVGQTSPNFIRIMHPTEFICEASIEDVGFTFYLVDAKKVTISLDNSRVHFSEMYPTQTYLLTGNRFTNSDIMLSLNGMRITAENPGSESSILNVVSENFGSHPTNTLLDMFMMNSVIEGKGNVTARFKYLVNTSDNLTFNNSNNVIRNARTADTGHQFDPDKNVII